MTIKQAIYKQSKPFTAKEISDATGQDIYKVYDQTEKMCRKLDGLYCVGLKQMRGLKYKYWALYRKIQNVGKQTSLF